MAEFEALVFDLARPGDAVPFLAPEGLAGAVPRLPLPCRLLRLAGPPGLQNREPLPASVLTLRGTQSLLWAGPAIDLETAGDSLPEPWRQRARRALAVFNAPASSLRFADGKVWDLASRTRVMGILNVTPDSFSDGGRFDDPAAALAHADRLLEEGADILDIGGESTRPGSLFVNAAEEQRRVIPLITAIRARHPQVRISIDTRRATVAEAALNAGADLINDVSALSDPDLAPLVAQRGCPVVLMHMRGTPDRMQADTVYDDLLGEVAGFLWQRIARAREAGIADDRILLDPGLGFGKSVEGNLALLRWLGTFHSLGHPLLLGASRKSFIGRLTGVTVPHERLSGSLAVAVEGARAGAAVLRVHDVAPTRQALALADALRLMS